MNHRFRCNGKPNLTRDNQPRATPGAINGDGADMSQFFETRPAYRILRAARSAQEAWKESPMPHRLRIIRNFRLLLVEQAISIATACNAQRSRPVAEALSAEVLPLVDACRFLERQAQAILAPRHMGRRGRPIWLFGSEAEVLRDPMGIILVLGPSNYPLFLPGVQALQALTAGNAVILKPGQGGRAAANLLNAMLLRAGMPESLLQTISENYEAAQPLLRAGVDKVVLTGSARSGRAVLQSTAHTLTPATMELSGCDAMFLREDADLDLAAEAILFTLRLNHGATCIAPRRIFVNPSQLRQLETRLMSGLEKLPRQQVKAGPALFQWLSEARSKGARIHGGPVSDDGTLDGPVIISTETRDLKLTQEDVFAPVTTLIAVENEEEAVHTAQQNRYALGASVFGRDEKAARALASRIEAGVITINDVIVPTADARLPFGGRKQSGFGVTRGAEGLLEMTVPKVITRRRGNWRPHLEWPSPMDAEAWQSFLTLFHGRGFLSRLKALGQLVRSLMRRQQASDQKPSAVKRRL